MDPNTEGGNIPNQRYTSGVRGTVPTRHNSALPSPYITKHPGTTPPRLSQPCPKSNSPASPTHQPPPWASDLIKVPLTGLSTGPTPESKTAILSFTVQNTNIIWPEHAEITGEQSTPYHVVAGKSPHRMMGGGCWRETTPKGGFHPGSHPTLRRHPNLLGWRLTDPFLCHKSDFVLTAKSSITGGYGVNQGCPNR